MDESPSARDVARPTTAQLLKMAGRRRVRVTVRKPNPDRYTLESVRRLLGYYETDAPTGARDITILDLISWSSDPGGDLTWGILHRQDADAWMYRRGPLAPSERVAAILYDFDAAMKTLDLQEQAIVALRLCKFTYEEIAGIIRKPDQRGYSDNGISWKFDAATEKLLAAMNAPAEAVLTWRLGRLRREVHVIEVALEAAEAARRPRKTGPASDPEHWRAESQAAVAGEGT